MKSVLQALQRQRARMMQRALCTFPCDLKSKGMKMKSLSSSFKSSSWRLNRRYYYDNQRSGQSDIKCADLVIEYTRNPKPLPQAPYDNLKFGREFTDHMLEIDWDSVSGWHKPVIKEYGSLQLMPACSALHYALQAIEGTLCNYTTVTLELSNDCECTECACTYDSV